MSHFKTPWICWQKPESVIYQIRFVLSGTSAKFSITFDLAWKVMKDILVQYYAITGFVTGSPREVLKQHCQTIIHLYIDKLYDFKTVVE